MSNNFKPGDRVRIIDGEDLPYFREGDIAVLKMQSFFGDWWADFSNQGNAHVEDDGIWCIGDNTEGTTNRFELVD